MFPPLQQIWTLPSKTAKPAIANSMRIVAPHLESSHSVPDSRCRQNQDDRSGKPNHNAQWRSRCARTVRTFRLAVCRPKTEAEERRSPDQRIGKEKRQTSEGNGTRYAKQRNGPGHTATQAERSLESAESNSGARYSGDLRFRTHKPVRVC